MVDVEDVVPESLLIESPSALQALALIDPLDRIERWLEDSDLDLAEIHLNGRSYRLERRDGLPLLPRVDSELRGLLCQVRTIPLGAGVQVVSVEGELDLHSSPLLEN